MYAVQCSAARRRLGGASSFTHTQDRKKKRTGADPDTSQCRTTTYLLPVYGSRRGGLTKQTGPRAVLLWCSGQPDEHKTEANSGGPTALVAAPRGSCQPQAGTAWGSAGPRRAGGRGIQDRNWTMRQMKRDGRGHGRWCCRARGGWWQDAGCRIRCRWDRPQNRFSVALWGEGQQQTRES